MHREEQRRAEGDILIRVHRKPGGADRPQLDHEQVEQHTDPEVKRDVAEMQTREPIEADRIAGGVVERQADRQHRAKLHEHW
ncbi:MAG: hypothetical protein GWO02_05785 [Gammaproteobacteria bacterium]|nr:hypothetical protein [Gammaproteobacteria bacterium]